MSTSMKSLALAGRILLCAPFIIAGPQKVLAPTATAAYMATGGLTESAVLALAVGAFEILCGLALATGFHTRTVALVLGAFTVLATAMFHPFWAAPPEYALFQQLFFVKNVAIVGGLLLIAATGAGAWSLDAKRSESGIGRKSLQMG